MDYSIHDAIPAGFRKIIFIIRKEIEADFREVIGNRIEAVCEKLDVESPVSMNMWGLTPEFVDLPEEGFAAFLDGIAGDELQAEYLLPIYIGQLLEQNRVSVRVLEISDKWFGVTYHEDKAVVAEAFQELYRQGRYGDDLYADIL